MQKQKESGEIMLSILVIEDDKTIKNLLCSIITKSGYCVDSAENGLDGLDKALSGARPLSSSRQSRRCTTE